MFPPFWSCHYDSLLGLCFLCQLRNDALWSGWDIAILRICWFGWKMPIRDPFLVAFADFYPLNVVRYCRDSQKSTNGCENTSFELSTVRVASGEKPYRKRFFSHAQSRNGWNYSNEILHIECLDGCSNIFLFFFMLIIRAFVFFVRYCYQFSGE